VTQGPRSKKAEETRRRIEELVAQYYELAHAPQAFVPGEDRVHYGGRVYDEQELIAAVDAALDFWLTAGPQTEQFEKELAGFHGLDHTLAVNSGSSANLVAMAALRSNRLEHHLEAGDEVITSAVAFPTTVAPILQNSLVPVFVDCQLGSYNLDPGQLEAALSGRTRAVLVAHTLGNPVDMEPVIAFAGQHDLYLIEDACDALGSTYRGQLVGSLGDLATLSFYPAHHITTGEGGGVVTSDPHLARIARGLRDWGRDCSCRHDSPPEGACGHRFEWRIPGLDEPYDHRYLYTEIGYNLKMTELQAAIGLAQLRKLPHFIAARRRNFQAIYEGLEPYEEFLLLPSWDEASGPAWFAFPITVRPEAPFSRRQITQFLEQRQVETRYLFAGNILRQPAFQDIECRSVGQLRNADLVASSTFFVGVFPGLDQPRIAHMLSAFGDFIGEY
jgi:CDP-6-deoxy-D-xylo-4-hexulose-3-dehydrase